MPKFISSFVGIENNSIKNFTTIKLKAFTLSFLQTLNAIERWLS